MNTKELNYSVRENGIYVNQCFGGGTEHSHGEDNIFLTGNTVSQIFLRAPFKVKSALENSVWGYKL